jgi:hypothetical protein
VPQFILEGFDLAFIRHQQVSLTVSSCSFVLLHTLSVMFRLHALQLQPSPVNDLVSEDSNEDCLEYRTTAVLVEVALNSC